MLNEVPDNNDIMCVANIVLNEVPNSNDATWIEIEMNWIESNVPLTIMGAQRFSVAAYIAIMQKSRLTRNER